MLDGSRTLAETRIRDKSQRCDGKYSFLRAGRRPIRRPREVFGCHAFEPNSRDDLRPNDWKNVRTATDRQKPSPPGAAASKSVKKWPSFSQFSVHPVNPG